MSTTTLYFPAATRKFKDFGFMQAYLCFKPDLLEERKAFGTLITIDDATLKPGAKGFGFHTHQDVEVVSLILQGEIKHIDPDNDRHSGTLAAKSIQIISAGTGIKHNEENNSAEHELHVLQIWFTPRQKDLTPAYAKKQLEETEYLNQLSCLLSPTGENCSLVVQQDAYLYYCLANTYQTLHYSAKEGKRRVFIYLINGHATINDTALAPGDGYGIIDCDHIALAIDSEAEFILFDLAN